ncbi:MAG: flagellar motor switch protein FliN [Acidobacteriota bacterium]|nr:flagellar motor switch protein FliN [Acidobacteriota bacterium]
MQSARLSDAEASVVQHLETAFASALTSMTGKTFTVTRHSGGEAGEMEEPFVWAQTYSVDAAPCLWLMAGRDLWNSVGQLTLAAVGIDSLTDEDSRSTWQEIVGQAMGSIASALTLEVHREITAVKGEECEAPQDVVWTVFSATHSEGGGPWYLKAAWPQALLGVFEPADIIEKPAFGRDTTFSKTFELLLDVALPVSVSFGKTALQIREVLKLNTGSIVELNRFVAEPVDVVVNDCVIARGEVVVVDGNYGVRVTQLASREDRLRTGITEIPAKLQEAVR